MTLAQPDDIRHSAEQCVWRHTTRAALELPENKNELHNTRLKNRNL